MNKSKPKSKSKRMETKTERLVSWDVARQFAHDASSVEDPSKYMWYKYERVYYPDK